MSWSAEYVAAENQVELAASGPVFNRDAREQAAEVIRLIKRHDADFVLVDYTRVVLEVSLANLYWLPEYYIELGAPQHVHVALILPPGNFQLESYEFFRVACRNAGYKVKLFDSRAAADAWLTTFKPTQVERQ